MEIAIAVVLVLILIAMPFVILAKVSGIAWEIRELKMQLKILANSDARTNDKSKAKCAQKVKGTAGPVAQPVVPPHVPAVETPKKESQQEPDPAPAPKQEPLPEPAPAPANPHMPPAEPEMDASGLFWTKIVDWFCVRGDFAPKGTTREFAIATRWLVRAGTAILVGAIAYFLMLAIDKGWIGPVQRVYGMMFWGVVGISAGAWIKLKRENYAILGEGAAALGLVALYLSFGLGHRFFNPPVIESYVLAFCGLAATTVLAGVLSVKLRSLLIAVLALVGGLLVPMIVQVGTDPIRLDAYLLMLALGACAVAHVRRWTAYGLAAIAAVFMVFLHHDVDHGGMVNGVFMSALYLLAPALALAGAGRRSQAGHNLCWAFVAASALVWTAAMQGFCFVSMESLSVGGVFVVASAVHAALAGMCHGRRGQVGNGLLVAIFLAVGFAAFALLLFLDGHEQWRLPSFCLFAAVLAELHARSGERIFGVLALLVAVACAAQGMFVAAPEAYGSIAQEGYGHAFLVRLVRLWCVPALAAFLGLRLNEEKMGSPSVRAVCAAGAVIMGVTLLTCESHWFGKLFLPELKGGAVTIAWAVMALAFLSIGIVCRRRHPRLAGLWVLAAAVAKLLLLDTASLPTPSRVGVFGLVGVVLIACAFLYLKFKSKFEER